MWGIRVLPLILGCLRLSGADAEDGATWKTPDIVLNSGTWYRIPDPFSEVPAASRPQPPSRPYGIEPLRSTASLLVLIAALQETRLVATLESIYTRAAHPDRVYVGIVQQNGAGYTDALEGICEKFGTPLVLSQAFLDRAEEPLHRRQEFEDDWGQARYTDESFAACKVAPRVRVYRMTADEAKGPVFARAQQVRLLGGAAATGSDEDFCMQIDAHSIFTTGWDVAFIDQWSQAQNEYAVLTTYPTNFKDIGESGEPPNVNNHWEMPHLCRASLHAPGMVRNAQAGACANLSRPPLGKLWAAGLSFGRCHAERDVPADPHLKQIFTGEEFSRGARLWTHGYDFYSLARPIIGTYYGGQKGNEGTWHHDGLELAESSKRLAVLLRHQRTLERMRREGTLEREAAALTGYDLGTRRSLEDYTRLTGVDTVSHVYAQTSCGVEQWVPWRTPQEGPANLWGAAAPPVHPGAPKRLRSSEGMAPVAAGAGSGAGHNAAGGEGRGGAAQKDAAVTVAALLLIVALYVALGRGRAKLGTE